MRKIRFSQGLQQVHLFHCKSRYIFSYAAILFMLLNMFFAKYAIFVVVLTNWTDWFPFSDGLTSRFC